MESAFKSVNLFPQTRFWRMGKKVELNHVFGGIASALLLIIIVSILILKLVDVFNRQTMTVTSEAIYSANMMTTFSTDMNNKAIKPVMVMVSMSSEFLKVVAYHSSAPNSFIPLEKCNKTHFAAFPQQYNQTYATQYCLPVGLNYPIYKLNTFMNLKLLCDSSYCTPYEYFTVTLFYPTPNVYQTSAEPWVYTDKALFFAYENKIQSVVVNLNQVRIKTDSGVFPFQQNENTTVGLDSSIDIHTPTFPSLGNNSGMVLINFQGSNYYTVYNRSFLKILDAFSYIGGIFNSLIAVFFFMKMYGQSFFEMNFARKIFRKKVAKDYGFFGFVKRVLYGLLSTTSCRPEWEEEQKRWELQKTISYLMDVVQLHRRLLYLQRALTVILQPHQLKGLQLVSSKPEELNDRSKKFLLRDKLISFFKDKQKRKKEFQVQFLSQKSKKEMPEDKKLSQQPYNVVTNNQPASDKVLQPGSALMNSNSQMLNLNRPNGGQNSHEEQQDEFISEELVQNQIAPCPEEIEGEISGDLKRLFEQAEGNFNSRSRAIVTLIDERIKQWMATALKEDRERYQFKFKFVSDKQVEIG